MSSLVSQPSQFTFLFRAPQFTSQGTGAILRPPCALLPAERGKSTTVSTTKVTFANCILVLVALTFALAENRRYYEQGYEEDKWTDMLRTALVTISLTQVGLLCKQQTLERKRNAQNTERTALIFPIEIGLHLVVLPPRVNMEVRFHLLGTSSILSLSDVALLIYLLRLYHFLRLIYAVSRFSSCQACFHA